MTGKPKSRKKMTERQKRSARIYADYRDWVENSKMKGVPLSRGRKKKIKNDVVGTYTWDIENVPLPPNPEILPHTRRITPKRDAIHKYPRGYSDYRRVLPTARQVEADSSRKAYSELPNRAVMRGKKHGARSGAYVSKSPRHALVYYRSTHRRKEAGNFVSPKSQFDSESRRY